MAKPTRDKPKRTKPARAEAGGGRGRERRRAAAAAGAGDAAAAAAAADAADAAAPAVAATPEDGGAAFRMKDLLARVAAATGAKPAAVRPAVDATLAALGAALAAGAALNLPPLGRLKVTRSRDVAGGATLQLRLRRGGGRGKADAGGEAAEAAETGPLAEAGADG